MTKNVIKLVILFYTFVSLSCTQIYNNKVLYEWDGSLNGWVIIGVSGEKVLSIPNEVINGRDNVVGIKSNAFKDKIIINEIVFPNTLIFIGESAFENASIAGNIVLPNSLKYLGEKAFNNAKVEGTLKLSTSLVGIGNYVFNNTKLKGSLVLPNTLENIGNFAFSDTYFDGALNIPQSVKSIGEKAFYNTNLKTININNNEINVGSLAFKSKVFDNSNKISFLFEEGLSKGWSLDFNRNYHINGKLGLVLTEETSGGETYYSIPRQVSVKSDYIFIPDEYNGKKVKLISKYAFAGKNMVS